MLGLTIAMKKTNEQLWQRFQEYYSEFPAIGLALDLSRMNFPDDYFTSMAGPIQTAFKAMAELEKGAIANPDEKRMVGHYWLRNSDLAPTAELKQEIDETLKAVKEFAGAVHRGETKGAAGNFKNVLVIGIGGSALGPQFVANALSQPKADKLHPYFFDNTDPDGIDKVLAQLDGQLGQTLCVVISKSGGTKETRNGMSEARAAYTRAGLKFEDHAVAVTGVGSELDKVAQNNYWLRRFPMWDWVGGRTSELSAVGLLPAALQGLDIDGLLAGAKACDSVTRSADVKANPSAQLALIWKYIDQGAATKDMVILPYKDRLELFSKYLQQLIMESLGKELDLDGKVVNQGIAVYGNKGSTDQHAYVQQLREGRHNFFVTFVKVLKDRDGQSLYVEPNVTTGDYLQGFLLGTRTALFEKDRESVTITVKDCSAFTVGVLIALYERAVGYYATLANINAYHQPGVESGKKAATAVLNLQTKLIQYFLDNRGKSVTVAQLAEGIGAQEEIETVFHIVDHLAANSERGVRKVAGATPFTATYQLA